MNNDKVLCGSGKIATTQFGDMPKVSFNKKDINTMVNWMKKNNSEWINLDMKKSRNPEAKNSHYLEVNTWKPEAKTQPVAETSDLPF